ncbi:MAG: hypothetical protein N2595_01620 [bacterium]|nr:hypothetical protein [bacterium]
MRKAHIRVDEPRVDTVIPDKIVKHMRRLYLRSTSNKGKTRLFDPSCDAAGIMSTHAIVQIHRGRAYASRGGRRERPVTYHHPLQIRRASSDKPTRIAVPWCSMWGRHACSHSYRRTNSWQCQPMYCASSC